MSITAQIRLPLFLAPLVLGLVALSLLATAPLAGAAVHAKKPPKAEAPSAQGPGAQKPPKPPKPPRPERPPKPPKPEPPAKPPKPPKPPKPEKPVKPQRPERPPKPSKPPKPGQQTPNTAPQPNSGAGTAGGTAASSPQAPASTEPVAVPSSSASPPPSDRSEPPTSSGDVANGTKADRANRSAKRRATASASSAQPSDLGESAVVTSLAAISGSGPGGNESGGSGAPGNDRRPSIVTKIVRHVPEELRYAIGGLSMLVVLLAGVSIRERRRSTRARHDAFSDPLTRVANRYGFDHRLASEMARSARYDRPLGLIMVDLNDFKSINDEKGHAEGDRVLRETAEKLVGRVRETDMVARIGGDEFVVICPETDYEGLAALARSLRRSISDSGFGASVGYAEFAPGQSGEELLACADTSMYADKRRRITSTDRRHLVAL